MLAGTPGLDGTTLPRPAVDQSDRVLARPAAPAMARTLRQWFFCCFGVASTVRGTGD